MQHVYEKFLMPLTGLYKIPAHVNKDEYLQSVANDLKDFDVTVLRQAFEVFRKSRKYTTMPSIADMISVCERLQKTQELQTNKDRNALAWSMMEAERKKVTTAWSEERKDWARLQLTMCPHAKQAAKEGWISWLYDHYRYNNTVPTQKQLRAMTDSFESDKRVMKQNPLGVRMWRDALNKRQKLKEDLTNLVLDGVWKA